MSKKEKAKTKKKSRKPLVICIILLFLLLCAGGVYLGWNIFVNGKTVKEALSQAVVPQPEVSPEPVKQVQIFAGENRPIACMIDNHSDAWPQFSINSAYMVYEIIVEGGETRLMALFKGTDAEKVGPMRSSRHYFLDYALENDAIYAHIGWSPQAQKDIKSLGVNNINGLEYDTGKAWKEGDVFWRISKEPNKTYKKPHNSITNTITIRAAAEKKGYRTTSTQKSVLLYVTDEVVLDEREDAVVATNVTIPFSTLQTVVFKYDPETQRYTRYARKQVQTDAVTSENITTKNIIITQAANYTLTDSDNKGRQGLKNIGTMNGYYITNGKAIPITCTKADRSSQTVYKDAAGNEIDVNDGNTFVEIMPTTMTPTFE